MLSVSSPQRSVSASLQFLRVLEVIVLQSLAMPPMAVLQSRAPGLACGEHPYIGNKRLLLSAFILYDLSMQPES